jgi:hypothetical protein
VRRIATRDKDARFTALLHQVTLERLRAADWAVNPGGDRGGRGEVAGLGAGPGGEPRCAAPAGPRWELPGEAVAAGVHPKRDGRLRPLGIAALEDKLLQRAVVEVLGAVYETDFRGCSDGLRPGRGPHDALDVVAVGIVREAGELGAGRRHPWVL